MDHRTDSGDRGGSAPTGDIRICERCWGVIAEGAPAVSLAHIDRALPDGTVLWRTAYLHPVTADVARAPRDSGAACAA